MSRFFHAISAKNVAKAAGRLAFTGVNVFCVSHLMLDYVGSISLTAGPSMLPTLAVNGDFVLEDRLSVHLNPTKFVRGELITLKIPPDPLKVACKRILGLPGDVICVDPTGQKASPDQHVLVPPGHVWVAGDNLNYSRDSRTYGPVPMGLIQGRILARVYPFHRFQVFRSNIHVLEE